MKNMVMIVAMVALTFAFFAPEQASAQLFRRWQERDDPRDETSHLPGADPRATRAPDYGAERVSEDIRNEVNGRVPVRPAPDFLSDTPLAQIAKQYQNPVSYIAQRPIGEGTRVQPPMTTHANRVAALPHWISMNHAGESLDQSDFSPVLDDAGKSSKAVQTDAGEATVSSVVSETQGRNAPNQEAQNGVGKLEWNKDASKKKIAVANVAQDTPVDPVSVVAVSADDKTVPPLNEEADVSAIPEDQQAFSETATDDKAAAETTPKTGRVRVPGLSLGTMLLRLSGF